ncbi:MAG TPA: hypothetical protein VF143_02340 [Candidatus Nanopelagicales bacterium]
MRPAPASTAAVAAVAALALAAPVQAAPLERDRYQWSDSGSFDDCGFTIDVAAHGGGLAMIREANPSTGGQFFRFSDNYWLVERYTNPANGRWIERTGNGIFFELPPSEVSADGMVFTYQTREAGQPFVMRDSAGTVLMRDRGAITLEYRFDSLGDGQPGGVQLQDPVLVRMSGPHPGWSSGCSDLARWLG